MALMSDERKLMKRDAQGRVVVPVARREALLDEFERSGLCGAEFARHAGVKYPTFAGWVQRRRHERGEYEVKCERAAMTLAPMRLAEAVFSEAAAGPSAESALEVLLPGGARVMLSNPAQVAPLARLLQALAEPC